MSNSTPSRSFELDNENDENNRNHALATENDDAHHDDDHDATPFEPAKDNHDDPMGRNTSDTNLTQDTIIFEGMNENEEGEEDGFDENHPTGENPVELKLNDSHTSHHRHPTPSCRMSRKGIMFLGGGILLAILVLGGITLKTKSLPFVSSSSSSSDSSHVSLDDSQDFEEVTPPFDDQDNVDTTDYYSSDEDGTEQSYHDNHGPIVESGPHTSPPITTLTPTATTEQPSIAPTKFTTTGRGPMGSSLNSTHNATTTSEPSMVPSMVPSTTHLPTLTSPPTNITNATTTTTTTTMVPSSSPTLTKTQPTTFVTTPTITSVGGEGNTTATTTTTTPTVSPAPSWKASPTPSVSPTTKDTTRMPTLTLEMTDTPTSVRQTTTSPSSTTTTMPTTTTTTSSVPTVAVVVKTTIAPTQNPTLSNIQTLTDAADAFLQTDTIIRNGEILHHAVSDLVFVQQTDGALVLYQGIEGLPQTATQRAPSEFLWSNDVSEPLGSYYTVLQGDGNMVTRAGTPENPENVVWASGSVSMGGMYQLLPNSESTGIEIRQMNGQQPIIWSSLSGIIRSGSTFCVVADVPYNDAESNELPSRMATLPQDCEFAVHLGDIKNGPSPCVDSVYDVTKQSLWKSPIPTFIVIGDNEWNDCPSGQQNQGLGLWKKHFTNFESYWNHDYLGTIHRDPNRYENFGFVYKSTLFVGLNMVGGAVINRGEWNTRLTQNGNWVQNLIRTHVVQSQQAKGVVLFGHAEPRSDHNNFFLPLEAFIRDELKNQIPILYLHGDGHWWKVVHPFYGQSSFLGVMAEGRRTTLKVNADPANFGGNNVRQAYTFEHIRW